MDLYIKIIHDPHANLRGFSIKGRRVRITKAPITDSMVGIDGKEMIGQFWLIEHEDFIRAIPEWAHLPHQTWAIPVEFAAPTL